MLGEGRLLSRTASLLHFSVFASCSTARLRRRRVCLGCHPDGIGVLLGRLVMGLLLGLLVLPVLLVDARLLGVQLLADSGEEPAIELAVGPQRSGAEDRHDECPAFDPEAAGASRLSLAERQLCG